MKAALQCLPESELFPELYSPAPPPAEMQMMGGQMSEIAPGIWTSGLPEFETPSHIVCKVVYHGTTADGKQSTYTLEPETYPGWVRMQDDIGKKIGMLGLSDTTMRRLLACGIVDSCRPTIGGIFISVESLLDHIRRTGNDTAKDKSWWTKERRELWRTVMDGNCNLEDGY